MRVEVIEVPIFAAVAVTTSGIPATTWFGGACLNRYRAEQTCPVGLDENVNRNAVILVSTLEFTYRPRALSTYDKLSVNVCLVQDQCSSLPRHFLSYITNELFEYWSARSCVRGV